MSENRIPEDLVICIDTSRSMFRKDFAPNRLTCCISAIKTLIKERFNLDNLSAFSLIAYSNKAEKIIDFTTSDFENNLIEVLYTLKCGGYSAMGDAIALSIKTLIAELRKVGAKTPRIVLMSDGNYMGTVADPIKMARLAQGLNIRIDTLGIGNTRKENILKRISDITGGRYFYNNDLESLIRSSKEIADDNYKTYGVKKENLIENPVFLRKIAAELLRVQDLTKDQEQRAKQIRGEIDFKKCSICFSDQNPYTRGSFYVTGRYCPNCTTPFHIHCLVAWADSQKDHQVKRSGTARCPHCFYLLKIPKEVTQIQKLRVLTKGTKDKTAQKPEIMPAKYIQNVGLLGDEALFNACPVCYLIFEKGQTAVQCSNFQCNALYHEECFKKLKKGHCRKCDVKLHLY
ncbi:MAG: VWA domain-containing protein [Candidatus Hodarchaeota archaeon]